MLFKLNKTFKINKHHKHKLTAHFHKFKIKKILNIFFVFNLKSE